MKRVCLLAAMILVACSIARAEVHIYEFGLDGAQAGFPLSPGTGHGHVTYDDVSNQLNWTVTYQNLVTPTNVVTNSHFHGPALPGVQAGVVVPQTNGFASPQNGGPVTLTDTQEGQLLGGLWYYNIHTTLAPGGEIRGQVVPEPASLGLLAVGAMGLMIRRPKI